MIKKPQQQQVVPLRQIEKQLEEVPLHDDAIERSALAAMLYDQRAAQIAYGHLTEAHFYAPINRTVFKALATQFMMFEKCDAAALPGDLRSLGVQDAFTLEYSRRIVTEWTSPANIEMYVHQLIDLKTKRDLRGVAKKIVDGATPEEVEREVGRIKIHEGLTEKATSEALDFEFDQELQGLRAAVTFEEWPVLGSTQCLLPGFVTVICGSPGASKSFYVAEAIWRWLGIGLLCSYMTLESGPKFHIRRMACQIIGQLNLMKPKWIRDNPAMARELWERTRAWRDTLKAAVHGPTGRRAPDCDFLLEWLRVECCAGKRVLIIDPITLMQTGERAFNDHFRFVSSAKQIIQKYDASLILVMHPRKGNPNEKTLPCLENLPLSAAYERFCETVFWLEWHLRTDGVFYERLEPYNRTMHCLKARAEERPGKIGYYFDGQTGRHQERGVIPEEE